MGGASVPRVQGSNLDEVIVMVYNLCTPLTGVGCYRLELLYIFSQSTRIEY